MKVFFAFLALLCSVISGWAVQVTFQVGMTGTTVSPNGVHLTGEFQGWNPGSTPLANIGNGLWSVTVEITPGTYQYKFVNGNDWGFDEVVPASCGVDNGFGGYNRTVNLLGGSDILLSPVCFGGCIACEPEAPQYQTVTFRVNMSETTESPNGVHIAGNFQGWNPLGTPMTNEGDGIWSFSSEFLEGTQLSYKFINGNAWPQQENVPSSCGVGDGFGGFNRTYTVGSSGEMLPIVCFGSCSNCSTSASTVMVLFQVDLSNTTVSPQGVHVAGSFQGWNPNGTVMTNLGGSVYEILYPVPTNSTIQFKFINGSEWIGQESVPIDCGQSDGFGGFNRFLEVGETNLAYGPVCFGACNACVPQTPVLVTFRVNMSNETVNSGGVYVVGDFNEWDPTATMMSEYQPGLYQAIGVVNSGSTVRYKFLNGPDFIGVENVPSSCGESDGFGGNNRVFTASENPEILPVVCFSGCTDCTGSGNVPVTFRVDMSEQLVSADGVHIAGSFNEFSPTASAMTQQSAGVYSFTANLPANTLVSYKFINGNDWPGVESVPFACGDDDGFGGYNRTAFVGATPLTLNIVCFSSCEACPLGLNESASEAPSVYPNPSDGLVFIQSNRVGGVPAMIYDASGRLVEIVRGVGTSRRMLDTSAWPAGFYVIHFQGTGDRIPLIVR